MSVEDNAMNSVLETVMDYLEEAGVDTVFGFPGETSLPIYIELQKRAPRIRHVLARSPRGAGYMADGYSRISGKVGICDVPGGIGSPFIVPAAHEANNSSVPLIILASGPSRASRGRWTTSSCNQQKLFSAVTRRVFYVDDEASIHDVIHSAFASATAQDIGPVFIEIPTDLLSAQASQDSDRRNSRPQAAYPSERQSASVRDLAKVAELINRAEYSCVLAGGGVNLSGASAALKVFAERAGCTVATTLNGKGAFPEWHPQSLGVAGAKGHMAANAVIKRADCLLVLGSKLGDKTCNYGDFGNGKQRMIHVDANSVRLAPAENGYLPVHADAGRFLSALTPLIMPKRPSGAKLERPPFWTEGPSHALCAALSELLPANGIVVADASVARGWAGAALEFRRPGQRLLTPAGSGSLSYALPAAIGAKFAAPDSQVIALGGDGGFSMAMHDLETAVRYRLPLLYVLLNNQSLGLIDKHATQLLGGSPVSKDFYDIAWSDVVRAHGWHYVRAAPEDNLVTTLRDLLPVAHPTLLELRVPAEEISPDYALTLEGRGLLAACA